MNSLDQKQAIPFEQELAHVRKYLSIEQVRFGEDWRVVYDVKATNFSLPPLSLQPVVENAVKHGVGMKEDSGTVTIATREDADALDAYSGEFIAQYPRAEFVTGYLEEPFWTKK